MESVCRSLITGPAHLTEAMQYSLNAGGKRLRPAIVLLSSRACGGNDDVAMPAAMAIEMIHTFSLIHDDLPAMDNDDLRRGKPTNHKVFGEALAILAGDGLMIFAFEVVAALVKDDRVARRMLLELANAAGPNGMTGGQVLDMDYDRSNTNPSRSEAVHLLKTAAMIRASAVLGALAANVDDAMIARMRRYGDQLGLAFQIVDDILDITGDAADVGKQTGKDAEAGKPNFALIVGVDAAQKRATLLIDQAIAELAPLGAAAEPLIALAHFVGRRTH